MDGKNMTLKTYQAKSMAEALAAVKRDLGRNAVILHTRAFKRGGIFGIGARQIVEVTAGLGDGVSGGRKRRGLPKDDPSFQRINAVRDTYIASTAASPKAGPSATGSGQTNPDEIAALLAELREAQAKSQRSNGAVPQRNGAVSADPVDQRQGQPETQPTASAPVSSDTATGSTARPKPHAPYVAPTEDPLTGATSDTTAAGAGAPEPRKPVYRSAKRLMLAGDGACAETVPTPPSRLDDQIADLRLMVSKVLQQTHRAPERGSMPEALFDRYLKLLEAEVSTDIANRVVECVQAELTDSELGDPNVVQVAVLRHLAAYIPVADVSLDRQSVTPGRPLVVAVVGPTGVGKTTTVAKLAAAYKLRHGKRVGLITTDTYRIAAVDQLRTYANIIGLTLRVALTPNEVADSVQALSDCDVILLDTAGRSQHDSERIDELRKFVCAAEPDETHLVLSSTSSEPLLLRAAERFAAIEPTGVIFTKLDEAVNFGVLVNVAQSIRKRISFVTTGQEVPDHIEVGRPDRLARLVVSGELT
jgi:flagellar biosynthesis protein FlhF